LKFSFFLHCKQKERKLHKERKTLAGYLRPSGVQTEWLNSAIAFAIAESL